MHARSLVLIGFLAAAVVSVTAQQRPTAPASGSVQTADWTTEQDHADMMRQLGITRLRPGPTADADAPNAANYDESTANPYPKLFNINWL
jgi:hypothetical protein